MSKDLASCPFCGTTPDRDDTRISMFAFGVVCRGCGATGPRHHVPDDNPDSLSIEEMDAQLSQRAIDSWNTRIGEDNDN